MWGVKGGALFPDTLSDCASFPVVSPKERDEDQDEA